MARVRAARPAGHQARHAKDRRRRDHHHESIAHARRPPRRAEDSAPQVGWIRMGYAAGRNHRLMPASATHGVGSAFSGRRRASARRAAGFRSQPLRHAKRGGSLERLTPPTLIFLLALLASPIFAQGRGGGRGGQGRGPAPTPKAAAAFDPTGYWVSVVTEDWMFRMVTPPKGKYLGVPMNAEARKVADSWDPAKDEA